jgi:putative DNA primase/helicase
MRGQGVSHSPETIREALNYIPAEDRDTWVTMGMAVKSELGDAGFDVWDSWSKGAHNYRERDATAQWRSFKETGGIGVGTLFYEAQQRGFKLNGHGKPIGAEELARLRAEREARLKEAEESERRANDRAAKLAAEIYDAAAPATDAHPYLQRKGVSASTGLRVGRWWQVGDDGKRFREKENCLLVPMRDEESRLWNLQAIFCEPDAALERDKDYLLGGRKRGTYYSVRDTGAPLGAVAIGEGLATMLSVRQATGLSIVVAFDKGNLGPVAAAIREKLPAARVIVCADNDIREGKPNYGVEKAAEAAAAVGAYVAVPDLGGKKADFNDLHRAQGAEAVKAAIEGALPAAPKEQEQRGEVMAAQHDERNPPPEGAEEKGAEWPPALDFAALAASEPEAPQHIIAGWLPAGEVTLFAGHGGAGKSAVALHIATAIALGRSVYGLEVARRRVLFVSAEDGRAVLHWRMARIAAHLGLDIRDLHGWLELIDASQLTAELMIDTREEPILTAHYEALADRMGQAQVLILDGASDFYGASEIVRRHVRKFIRSLRRLVPADGAALLLAHIDKAVARGKETGDHYSGSTAWNNSVRARWALRQDAQGEGLTLALEKANHAKAGAEIRLRWNPEAHIHVAEASPAEGGIVGAIRERQERDGILAAMKACAAAGISVPAATQGQRTAYHVLKAQAAFPASLVADNSAAKRKFWAQIEQLRAIDHVREGRITRNDRHKVVVLELTPEGLRACGQ